MTDGSRDGITELVSSIFIIGDVNMTDPATIVFRIVDDDTAQFKTKFVNLQRKLDDMDCIGRAYTADDYNTYISIQKFAAKKTNRFLESSWVPRVLFVVVVAFVMIDGFYRTAGTNAIVQIGDPLAMAAIYTLGLLGILGVHELGHIIAARLHGIKTTWPYFIPGLPIIGIPTFGAFIQSRGLTVNREILFDIAIAGPVAGLVIAIIVSVYGAYTAPVIGQDIASGLFENQVLAEWNQGEPLFMTASLALFGKGGEGGEVIMTPLLFAAWIGFLITFLNMLPAWQLDGGHMARTLLKPRIHQYATYASMGVLVLLGYWLMAVLILVMSSRRPSANPLDDVSPLSKNRKLAYVAIVGLAILCAPLPSEFVLFR